MALGNNKDIILVVGFNYNVFDGFNFDSITNISQTIIF